MEEFVLPEFLQETEDQIHERMIRMAPPNTDTSEGHLFWDHTRPTAMVRSRLVEYELTLALMMKFPQFAVGPFLDWHGYPIGVYRRPAVKAVGDTTFYGKVDTPIPQGTIVSTIGDDNEAATLFEVVESGSIGELGEVTLRIEAVEAGVLGNVPQNTIIGITKPINGLTSLTNNAPTKNGADPEDDDSYRQRILDRHRNKPLSGAKHDYVRWAKEVPGVGDVIVLPLWNGPKTVKVLITDNNRQLASPELISAVKQHIDPVDGMGEGTAPIGAVVTVDTLTLVTIDIKFTSLQIEEDYELHNVIKNIRDNLEKYFIDRPVVKWAEVVTTIVQTDGVEDHSGLFLNGEMHNIPLGEGERATVGQVTIE